MVEYVLLIVFSVVLALIVYGVLKTYVPQNKLECPEGTSLLIESYNYNCANQELTFTIRNDGRFNVTGYYVYVSDSPEKEVANININKNNTDSPFSPSLSDLNVEGIKLGMGSEPLPSLESTFEPGNIEVENYDLTGINDRAYTLTIVPIRWQSEKGKMKVVSCADQKTTKSIECT